LAGGLVTTLQIAALTIVLSMILAVPVAVARMAEFDLIRWIAQGYIELFRCTPMLVQLFWIYFVLPLLVGIQLVPLFAGVLVLGLNHGAYGAEIVRGAVQSVPRAQYEGCIALSLSPAQRMRRVILPQAVVEMLPPFNNLFIQLLKSTAILSFVFIHELTRQAKDVLVPNFNPWVIQIYLLLLLYYLIMALAITAVMRMLERMTAVRLGRRLSRGAARALAGTH
jgi:polar amino acid transport system permease protein